MSSAIEGIRARLSIQDIVSGHVTLRRAGRLYKGLCPFHEEKTPSFMVDPRTQRFRCYGCGAHGDAIDFLAKIKNLDTRGAIRHAADLAGVSLDRPLSPGERARLEREARDRKTRRRCMEMARRASLAAERGLPRPKGEGDLKAYDALYAVKDNLDEGLTWVGDIETLGLFVRGIASWRRWAETVLDQKGGDGR